MYYFDWAATSPISTEALNVYAETCRAFPGNPSSVHALGQSAKARLEEARAFFAAALKVQASEVFFTSGGTEADNIVIQSLINSPSQGEILAAGMEHPAVLENRHLLESRGWKFTLLPCQGGILEPSVLASYLNPRVRMVCVMKVNNVTGAVQDTKALAGTVREYEKLSGRKIHIHCDAVQALGKFPFYPAQEGLDSAAFSAHKFCGPRGVGILYCKNKGVTALSRGGGQEKGLRGGTENLPGICAMQSALSAALEKLEANLEKTLKLRGMVERCALENGLKVLSPSLAADLTAVSAASGKALAASPYIINISVSPVPSEVFIRVMSDRGFCLSAGSACSSNSRGKAESVLAAMGFSPEDRRSSVRISLGYSTTEEETGALCSALTDVYNSLVPDKGQK